MSSLVLGIMVGVAAFIGYCVIIAIVEGRNHKRLSDKDRKI